MLVWISSVYNSRILVVSVSGECLASLDVRLAKYFGSEIVWLGRRSFSTPAGRGCKLNRIVL
jgi:hypothetical protein